jgi:hypothetical protein
MRFTETMMTRPQFGVVVLVGVMLIDSAFCRAQDAKEEEVAEQVEQLVAFAHLGAFADRGLFAVVFRRSPALSGEDGRPEEPSIPREVLELLETREGGVLKRDLWRDWLPNQEERSAKELIRQFRNQGLLELFRVEDSRILDSPLSERKELMERLEAVVEPLQMQGLIAPGMTDSSAIILAAQLRTSAVEIDSAILRALTRAELTRLSKVIAFVMPSAIEDVKKWNRQFPLGSIALKGRFGKDTKP